MSANEADWVPIACAKCERADELPAEPPSIKPIDVITAKLPE